jgi:hypothetical protein
LGAKLTGRVEKPSFNIVPGERRGAVKLFRRSLDAFETKQRSRIVPS